MITKADTSAADRKAMKKKLAGFDKKIAGMAAATTQHTPRLEDDAELDDCFPLDKYTTEGTLEDKLGIRGPLTFQSDIKPWGQHLNMTRQEHTEEATMSSGEDKKAVVAYNEPEHPAHINSEDQRIHLVLRGLGLRLRLGGLAVHVPQVYSGVPAALCVGLKHTWNCETIDAIAMETRVHGGRLAFNGDEKWCDRAFWQL